MNNLLIVIATQEQSSRESNPRPVYVRPMPRQASVSITVSNSRALVTTEQQATCSELVHTGTAADVDTVTRRGLTSDQLTAAITADSRIPNFSAA